MDERWGNIGAAANPYPAVRAGHRRSGRCPYRVVVAGAGASRELVGVAPYRESGYRLLMTALVARGNGTEATRVYDTLLHRLWDDLGVLPSDASRALHAELLTRFG
jgi:hypothetical protein